MSLGLAPTCLARTDFHLPDTKGSLFVVLYSRNWLSTLPRDVNIFAPESVYDMNSSMLSGTTRSNATRRDLAMSLWDSVGMGSDTRPTVPPSFETGLTVRSRLLGLAEVF